MEEGRDSDITGVDSLFRVCGKVVIASLSLYDYFSVYMCLSSEGSFGRHIDYSIICFMIH